MSHPTLTLIERRVSANRYDPEHVLTDEEIAALVRLATRAPTAFNLQNWRFIAVRAPEAKEKLRELAYGQGKVADAAVTFIICGSRPDHTTLLERLRPFVDSGFMPAAMAEGWRDSVRAAYGNDPGAARDEAIRSATLGAAMLMVAAEAMGFASGPMVGFDAQAVAREFGLADDEIPVMLLPVGRAAPGNWPQKPRRPLSEVLQIS